MNNELRLSREVQRLSKEIAILQAQLARWQRWTQGHVWIRTEEYAELCQLKQQHGSQPPGTTE